MASKHSMAVALDPAAESEQIQTINQTIMISSNDMQVDGSVKALVRIIFLQNEIRW